GHLLDLVVDEDQRVRLAEHRVGVRIVLALGLERLEVRLDLEPGAGELHGDLGRGPRVVDLDVRDLVPVLGLGAELHFLREGEVLDALDRRVLGDGQPDAELLRARGDLQGLADVLDRERAAVPRLEELLLHDLLGGGARAAVALAAAIIRMAAGTQQGQAGEREGGEGSHIDSESINRMTRIARAYRRSNALYTLSY